MLQFLFVCWGLLLLLRRLIVAHLAIINEGTPTPGEALEITDVTLAQAFYGRLGEGAADYYHFEVTGDTEPHISLLVPEKHYTAGFRPVIRLTGGNLPAEGLLLPPGDEGKRDGTTRYQRTQRANPTLPAGSYLLEIRGEQAGVYCFCCGAREPAEYADHTTRARVRDLLDS